MKGKIFISLLGGVIFGGVWLVIVLLIAPEIALPVALLTMAAFSLFLHVALSISEARTNKKFAKIERMLPAPVLYQTVANFNLDKNVLNGRVYLCRDAIVLASVDQKPYSLQSITPDQLWRYELDEIRLRLYTNDGKVYHLLLPDAAELVQKIKENYWKAILFA